MAKAKGKGGGKKGSKSKAKDKEKKKKLDIPEEWVGKSIDELKLLVSQLQGDLDDARNSRSKAQAEHASIQSYYDVTRELIRDLSMRIELKDYEIENKEDDNATELRVYREKTNFIKYCHDQKLNDAAANQKTKLEKANTEHSKQVEEMGVAQMDKTSELASTEEQQTTGISNLQQDNQVDVYHIKERLDADISLFEQRCEEQRVELKKELDSRRETTLKIIDSKKDSHLNDLAESHEHRCMYMQLYFQGVERQQEIDIEDLEAEIRRLKKASIQHAFDSNQLRESNATCGEDLKKCTEKVATLECQTKDKEKDCTSLRYTNARLSVARKAIAEAWVQYKQLQGTFAAVEDERDSLQAGINGATKAVVKESMLKQGALQDKLKNQQDDDTLLELHLQHTLSASDLDKDRAQRLKSNTHYELGLVNQELESLRLCTANATHAYQKAVNSCTAKLQKRGAQHGVGSLDSLLAVGKEGDEDKENIEVKV